jgi:hypothetical protein
VTVVVNDAALATLLRSTNGPVGQDLALRAFNVAEQARINASGPILGVQTRDLLSGIIARVDANADGLFATVSTPAIHRGFFYPAFHDKTGRPWLTSALRDGFRRGRTI